MTDDSRNIDAVGLSSAHDGDLSTRDKNSPSSPSLSIPQYVIDEVNRRKATKIMRTRRTTGTPTDSPTAATACECVAVTVPPCRCGHLREDHLRIINAVCMRCSCGQYLPDWPGWATDPEDCARCLELQDTPCAVHSAKGNP